MRAERHPREAERLGALYRYGALDTPREAEFDEIVALASRICETPVALVTLLETDRQWFKAAVGTDLTETPFEASMCAHAVLQGGMVEVPDLERDERFKDNVLVTGDPHARFYAGVPLETPEGLPLGTLCVLDTQPRVLTDLQRDALRVLGRQVMAQLELRRQAREAKASRREVEETLDRAEIGTWRYDAAANTISGNPRAEGFYGFTSPADIDVVRQKVHPDDRPLIAAAHAEAVRTGNRYEAEYRATGPDGVQRWLLARGDAELGPDGQTVALSGVVIDVSERAHANEALAAERRQFRRLLDEVPAHVVTLQGPELRYDFANRAFLGFVGGDDFLGKAAHEAWSVPTEHLTMLRNILATGEPVTRAETLIPTPSGGTAHFDFLFQPLREADGAVSGVFVHSLDVTEKVRAREALRQSEERFRIVAQATRDAVWDWDLRDDSVWWNEGIAEMLGHATYEPTAAWWIEHIHPDDRERVSESIHAAIDGGQANWSDEYRYLKADGTAVMVEDRGFLVFDAEGNPARMVGAMADVTERRLAQRQLESKVAEATAGLRAAMEEAERFNYSISHDLRTPLRAINATAQMLLEDAGTDLSEFHRELLERQAFNANRLGLLIDQLLRLSRLGRAEVHRAPLDVTALARAVAEEIGLAEGAKMCRIEVQDGMAAEADAALVRLVFGNLLENACKFSKGQGTVRVRQEGPVFSVSDEGAGFDMKYAAKLFLPFERLVRDSEFPGTGIGLANVERIVRRHGGKVWAESEPGKGATFSFTLAP